jgi:hypothetical protein
LTNTKLMVFSLSLGERDVDPHFPAIEWKASRFRAAIHPSRAVLQISQHCRPAYNFCADDKPVVVSALQLQNPSLRSLDRTLEMGGRVWSML